MCMKGTPYVYEGTKTRPSIIFSITTFPNKINLFFDFGTMHTKKNILQSSFFPLTKKHKGSFFPNVQNNGIKHFTNFLINPCFPKSLARNFLKGVQFFSQNNAEFPKLRILRICIYNLF